jgi:AcrR family transcriptional regulator
MLGGGQHECSRDSTGSRVLSCCAQRHHRKTRDDVLSSYTKGGVPIISSSSSLPAPTLGTIRVEPVQVRSSKRLVALLDATAGVIADIGYETLTTAMVADRAGASIGTVYRYFPDRIAVLQALISRNRQRAEETVMGALRTSSASSVREAMDVVFDSYVGMFRDEPGFRSLRLGDVVDIRPAQSARTGNSDFAQLLGDEMAEKLSLTLDSTARLSLESAVDVMDGLVARAFLRVDKGDKAVIDEARRLFHLCVTGII